MPASARTDVDQGGEEGVGEAHPAAGVLEDERQLPRGQAQVERVDHAAAEEAGVVELEELVSVEGHDREAVAPAHAELAGHAVDQPTDPVPVLGEGGGEVAVEDRSPWSPGARPSGSRKRWYTSSFTRRIIGHRP